MKNLVQSSLIALIGAAFAAGCGADYQGNDIDAETDIGSSEQAVAACVGDDLQYDFNGFAASLAVAIANELGDWDVATDFVVSNGKLALSSTGLASCTNGCANVKDILLLQEDVTASIPNHSPSIFRTKLTTWYAAQMAKQVELATGAKLAPGTYRIKNKNSAKNIVVDANSTADGALIEQNSVFGTNAADWVVSVVGTKHMFKNALSGKCMDLASASSAANVNIVQKTCSATSATQLFNIVKADNGLFSIETAYAGKGLTVFNWGTANDVRLVQDAYFTTNTNQQFQFTSVAGADLGGTLFKGMYRLEPMHTAQLYSKALVVANRNEGAAVTYGTWSASNPLHQWYAYPVGTKYQLVNRSSGKCFALASDSATAVVVQKTCANVDTQLFGIAAVATAGSYTLTTKYSKLLEVANAGSLDGTAIQQVSGTADPQRVFRLTAIMAGEPHKLTFNHVSHDGPCGDYFWYDIKSPNGLALQSPQETYFQLIFAGGKPTQTGTDENPFIAQLVAGNQVAIDPSGYMNPTTPASSGSCIASDVYYDSTKAALNGCCIKSTGVTGKFATSSWSTTTFVCN